MGDFEDGIARQPKGPLSERERQTFRYMMELAWSGLRSRQKWSSMVTWIFGAAVAALALTQLPDAFETALRAFFH